MLIGIAGFFVPWVIVDRGSVGEFQFGPIDLPVGNVIGMVWLGILVVLAAIGWLSRWRPVLVVGALAAVPTALVFLILAIVLSAAPHFVPLWLLPKEARSYVPAIGVGSGEWLACIASIGLFVWFIAAAVVRPPRGRRHLWREVRSKLSWARTSGAVPDTAPTLNERGEDPAFGTEVVGPAVAPKNGVTGSAGSFEGPGPRPA
jgi:hypothetical protein